MNCKLCHEASSGYFKLHNSSSSTGSAPDSRRTVRHILEAVINNNQKILLKISSYKYNCLTNRLPLKDECYFSWVWSLNKLMDNSIAFIIIFGRSSLFFCELRIIWGFYSSSQDNYQESLAFRFTIGRIMHSLYKHLTFIASYWAVSKTLLIKYMS